MRPAPCPCGPRSEEHTSELQSQSNLVCRLLLEKKKKTKISARENEATVEETEPRRVEHRSVLMLERDTTIQKQLPTLPMQITRVHQNAPNCDGCIVLDARHVHYYPPSLKIILTSTLWEIYISVIEFAWFVRSLWFVLFF